MKRTQFLRLLLILAFAPLLGQSLYSDAVSDASDRMRDRLKQIDELKISGQVGETSKGFLEIRGSLNPRQSSLVEAENADRKILYTKVAEQTNQTLDEVGEQRAIQTAARARSGVWLQKPDGTWYQKP